jgi:hypothetical protein
VVVRVPEMRSFRIPGRLAVLLLLGVLPGPFVTAQSKGQVLASTDQTTTVRSIRAIPGYEGSAVEIISDGPLVPAIGKVDDPPRVVIDLPNARLSDARKRIAFRSSEITGVRVSQFQQSVARIVIDLAQPVSYTWDAAGNRLMIRLHAEESGAKAASVPAFTPQAPPAVVPLSSATSGAVVLAGSRLAAGSSVTAGSDTAVLSLGRGGEVRVCPGTTVSVTPSQNGRSLMLGMSTGGLEVHYMLDASSDSILTPDFRILLAGPGEFHYGISADPRGNTCVQALPGNTASVIVSEVLGDGTYQVKPAQQVVFHSGQLKTADSVVLRNCGCPAPALPIMRTSSQPAVPEAKLPSAMELARSVDYDKLPNVASSASLQAASSVRSPETAALPPSRPDDVHVQVDVPFIFRANDPGSEAPAAGTAPTHEAELLPIRDLPHPGWFQIAALPPPQAKAPHHGFFGKLKGFFSAVFG